MNENFKNEFPLSLNQIKILNSIDPDVNLDDLKELRDIIGDSRIVAIGEGSHFMHEFWKIRQRLLRFLREECGFTIFLMEFGFAEGFKLSPWINGEGTDDDIISISPAATNWGAGEALFWLRQYNKSHTEGIKFFGIDIPEGGGSLMPALIEVRNYLKKVDPDIDPIIQKAIEISKQFDSLSAAKSAPMWSKMSPDIQDKLTALLTRISYRFHSAEPFYVKQSSQYEYDKALHQLYAATHSEYMLRVMNDLNTGSFLPADMSSRERFMADSVIWHLKNLKPESRIVVAAHNNHIQRTTVNYGGFITAIPMGKFLADYFGKEYCPIGITTTDNHTAEMELDENTKVGFIVKDIMLDPPPVGSFEEALMKSGFGDKITLTDLFNSNEGISKINCIRSQSSYVTTNIKDAFDGIISIPKVTMIKELGF